MIKVVDNFFSEPGLFRMLVLDDARNQYKTEYGFPTIRADVPSIVRDTFIAELESVLKRKIKVRWMFTRLMMEGHNSPNTVHTDEGMGEYSAHVYMTAPGAEVWMRGNFGTSFWYKLKEFTRPPEVRAPLGLIRAQFNRLLIHRSEYLHCAEPISGFGTTPEDGRLVLTCFFDMEEK